MSNATAPSAIDTAHLRTAIQIANESVAAGNHPFGAVLADPDGTVVLSAQNSVVTERDVTCHAETNLVRLAMRRYDPDQLGSFTLYTSCEPCAMCAGAIYWSGIGRVVFALGETTLYELTGINPDNPTLAVPSRVVFGGGQRSTEVVGPALEDEAAVAHESFWR
ncbi:nucleoside deaminase [Microbacterium sp. R86528]|uniref:nucleoside deaminase n=1 Tax=Microbacterium sp. R86528 TaxID=3093864 RepID=UPI0037C5D7D3